MRFMNLYVSSLNPIHLYTTWMVDHGRGTVPVPGRVQPNSDRLARDSCVKDSGLREECPYRPDTIPLHVSPARMARFGFSAAHAGRAHTLITHTRSKPDCADEGTGLQSAIEAPCSLDEST